MDGVDRIGSTALRLSRLALYLAWTVPLMPVQAIGLLLRRSWVATFPRVYHPWCCRILGLRVRRVGHPGAPRPGLFAANHVSYIDISVFGSLIAGSFVAKSEVAGWPLFGWLARLQRTVFIDRRVRSTVQQRDSIAGRLAAKEALILFPEGTSGNGNRVLPFKSALFSVADQAGSEILAIQPVSIAYTRLDGMPIGRALRPFFAWYGGVGVAPPLLWVLGLGPGEIVVVVHPPPPPPACGSRKMLARYCEERVASGLEAALTGRRQGPPASPPEPQRLPAAGDVPAPALG